MRITVVARKIEDIAYAYTILFGGGEGRGQTSTVEPHYFEVPREMEKSSK